MDDKEVGKYWNDNANGWAHLTSAGYDIYRDHLNTPAFFKMLPNVSGLSGIDIGCGDGHHTRMMSNLGAQMTGIDIAENFILRAKEQEKAARQGIKYKTANAAQLPFSEGEFDFATAIMSLMDIAEPHRALAETFRVLSPAGFLQFSISHPCFDTLHRRNCRNETGQTYAIEVGEYFNNRDGEIDEWIFGSAPEELKQIYPKFKIPRFTRTLSEWMNLLVDHGFVIEKVGEPKPTDEQVRNIPQLQDSGVVAYFLHVRVRKP